MKKITLYLRKGFLLLIAVAARPFKRPRKQNLERILVIQAAKLGDMVCTTPVFRAIKEKYPRVHLTVMGDTLNQQVLAGNPHVDDYAVISFSLLDTYHVFVQGHFDTVCITSPNFEMAALASVARIPLIVVPEIKSGWSPYVTMPYRIFSRFIERKDHHMGNYAPREYLRLLEPIGIYTEDTRKEVFFTPQAEVSVLNRLSYLARPIIGIVPGAGNEIKSWAPEKFAELMNDIASYKNVIFVLLGAKKDQARAEVILNGVAPHVRVESLIGTLSIDELKACIQNLYMLIGADTGPQYIAEALEIPTIDIVGPVDEREQPPMGILHKIVKVDRKRPALYVMNARVYDREEAERQTREITAGMVYQAFKDLDAHLTNTTP